MGAWLFMWKSRIKHFVALEEAACNLMNCYQITCIESSWCCRIRVWCNCLLTSCVVRRRRRRSRVTPGLAKGSQSAMRRSLSLRGARISSVWPTRTCWLSRSTCWKLHRWVQPRTWRHKSAQKLLFMLILINSGFLRVSAFIRLKQRWRILAVKCVFENKPDLNHWHWNICIW